MESKNHLTFEATWTLQEFCAAQGCESVYGRTNHRGTTYLANKSGEFLGWISQSVQKQEVEKEGLRISMVSDKATGERFLLLHYRECMVTEGIAIGSFLDVCQ